MENTPASNSPNTGGGAGPDSAADDEEAEADDPSSTDNIDNDDSPLEDALDKFRSDWKKELNMTSRSGSGTPSKENSPAHNLPKNNSNSSINSDVYERARALFLEGVECERKGFMYDAIRCYHQAVHLVPDIEQRLFNSMTRPNSSGALSQLNSGRASPAPLPAFGIDNYDGNLGLDMSFNNPELISVLTARLYGADGQKRICRPTMVTSQCHISQMPAEVLLHIFKWTVGSGIDVRSIEQLSLVCSGFYILSRDPELWRLCCFRTWGPRTGLTTTIYPTWRLMYIRRPHLRFDGLYISKITYIRYGEASYQDQFYRPWHIVVYYRYVRFHPNGLVYMLTTAEDPLSIVPLMATGEPRYPGVLRGIYQFQPNEEVIAKFTRAKPKHSRPAVVGYQQGEQEFTAEFQIRPSKRRPSAQLGWISYQYLTRYKNGRELVGSLLGNEQQYPTFYFSRVKSYARVSNSVLK